jgi:uncharacterized protein YgiM (DUF1202 family)
MISKLASVVISFALFAAAMFGADGDPVTATTRSKSIVRFGPNLSAPVAGTLPVGTPVTVLGKAPGADGWFIIRFPRQCTAWMHEKVIQAINGNKQFKVIEDKARVRADSTQGSQIVAELNVNDVVDSQNKQIGAWYAVYPPQAIVYIYSKNLDMPQVDVQVLAQQQAVDDESEQLWQVAQRTYAEYKNVANTDNRRAYTLDWPGLAEQLAAVVRNHPSKRAKLTAQELKDGVDRVVKAQREKGARPTVRAAQPKPRDVVAELPKAPVIETPVVKRPEVVKQPEPAKPAEPVRQPEVPKQPEVVETPAVVAANAEPVNDMLQKPDGGASAVSLGAFTIEGWLEQREVPEIGVGHVLIDANSNVVAYVKVKDGKNVQLSEYFWRLVSVSGDRISSNNGEIPIIMADNISMPNR